MEFVLGEAWYAWCLGFWGRHYLCMLPGAIAYTYLGYAGREALSGSADLIQKALIALALLAVLAFLPRLITQQRGKPASDIS